MYKVYEFDPSVDDFVCRGEHATIEGAVAHFKLLSDKHTHAVIDCDTRELVVARNAGDADG